MKALPLEKQVASLEPMQELVGLGLKVESYFMWYEDDGTPYIRARGNLTHKVAESFGFKILAPALTVAELLDILSRFGPALEYDGMYWDCYVRDWGINGVDVNPADALAELLAEIIKEGHVTVEELNNG